ncbi:hypothetical protein [Metabacillus arenae]|uniref:Uncharacterized protein n=1 Tax=Metabacillus arenae TaxID=2771434 RepID=A0A926NPH0_9BACI|nr:hypothetical protein [Metabacillus arenae]MBD1381546.1 hypothetical protein [Metabacillus arenae]
MPIYVEEHKVNVIRGFMADLMIVKLIVAAVLAAAAPVMYKAAMDV